MSATEQLIDMVAQRVHEAHSPKIPWEKLHPELQEMDRAAVRTVAQALGLTQETRDIPVRWADTNEVHYYDTEVRYVTDWRAE